MASAKTKTKTVWVCDACGEDYPKWQGQCPSCREWNTLREMVQEAPRPSAERAVRPPGTTVHAESLRAVRAEDAPRLRTGIAEFDRVLGGGFVPGGVVLLGGDPGIGKSTLLLEVCARLAAEHRVVYASGEESKTQVKMRADRLSEKLGPMPEALLFQAENQVETIIDAFDAAKPAFVVVDSVQTIFCDDVNSSAGSPSQVRESAQRLTRWAKASGTAMIVIAHVTKEGTIAGPRMLEHLVDAVLYLEGERFDVYRKLFAVKNRFGSTDEAGYFEMAETGLDEVVNPTAIMQAHHHGGSGSVITATVEGTRAVPFEVQALAVRCVSGNPRQVVNGLDAQRVRMLTAVVSKRIGIPVFGDDLHMNLVGGVRCVEPAIDLAAIAAIVSSSMDVVIPPDVLVVGEVGLGGELRPVGRLVQRVEAVARLGFTRAIVPKSIKRPHGSFPAGVSVVEVADCRTALEHLGLLGRKPPPYRDGSAG
jgi:DNA repair protein RadA/Sms